MKVRNSISLFVGSVATRNLHFLNFKEYKIARQMMNTDISIQYFREMEKQTERDRDVNNDRIQPIIFGARRINQNDVHMKKERF